MRNQQKNGIFFRSSDIEIIMKEEVPPEMGVGSYLFENKSSFNLLFLLSSNISMKPDKLRPKIVLQKNQYLLHYTSEENKTEWWSTNDETLKYLHIKLRYKYIFNLINPEYNKEGVQILENMIQNNFIFFHEETPPTMTVEMHMIIKEMISYSKEGILRKLFMQAKVIKLLILIFEQFNEKSVVGSSPKIPETVKRFIDENYHRNIRAEEIGRLIGINQNSIRKEFKAQYHTTIAHYILELRMLKARKLITNKDIMIKEIAIECGYEYIQNFTRAFKKKFGVSPENLRNNT
ncbi:helix-turn-helix transcriptional regulator [Chryseobacterium phosphatilyticum]|nr:helix-turn-helix domain-containing protein [Chryseobacterium phosphatilyticum]